MLGMAFFIEARCIVELAHLAFTIRVDYGSHLIASRVTLEDGK